MNDILVTGGSGFVGGHLVDELVDRNCDITLLDVHTPSDVGDRYAWFDEVDYVQGSVNDEQLVQKLVHEDLDQIFHLAALVGVEDYCERPLGVIDTNVMGSRLVFEAAAENDVPILFSSTSEVFGKNSDVPWSETDDRVLGPTAYDRWSYSTSKALCEHMLYGLQDAKNLEFTIVRYFNLYGPRQEPSFVVPAMIDQVVQGQPPVVFDGGDQTRCFTFVEDAIEGTLAAAEAEEGNGESFNIGNPTETRIIELAETILEISGRSDLDVVHKQGTEVYDETYEDLDRRVPDVSKVAETLGWRAGTSLEDGLERTLAWFQEEAA